MTRRIGLVALFLLACAPAEPWSEGGARAALRQRGAADQLIRDTLVLVLQGGGALASGFMRRVFVIDSENAAWLDREVAHRGWPRRSVVGPEEAGAALLIVQHAVHDTAFMARALRLMEPLVADSEARGSDVAMLADRRAVERGGRQLYGTQAKLIAGRLVMDPIADSAGVDARRAALGMPPLARSVAVLESLYTARPAP